MNELIKHKDTIYKYVDGGLIHGYVKSNDIPEDNPFIEWQGEKMPHELWQSILAFFIWSFIDTKPSSDEALVRVYYNEATSNWLAWAPPQRGSGMTVRTVDDHPNWKQEEAFEGYVLVGTGHHHCAAKAFQSGTDSSDEKLCNGLHFTVGDLDKTFVSIHARAVFNGNMQEVLLDDWVELAPKYRELNLPPELIGTAYNYSLQSRPDKNVQFPATWKENYLKYTSYNSTQGTMGFNNNGHCSAHVSQPVGKGYWKDEWMDGRHSRIWVSTEEKKQESTSAGNSAGRVTSIATSTPSERGEVEMEQLMKGGVSITELSLISEEMSTVPRTHWDTTNKNMMAVCEILSKHGLNPRWFEKWVDAEEQMQTWQNAV